MRIDIGTIAPFALFILLGLLFYMKKWHNRSTGYLICFAAFYVYLLYVVGYTVFPLVFNTEFVETMRRQTSLMSAINFVPFRFCFAHYTILRHTLGNVALGVPFGFGLPFIAPANLKLVTLRGFLFAISLELVQLAIDLGYGFAYRAVDVNDVLLNFSGVFVGYGLFRVLAWFYGRITPEPEAASSLWSHFHAVLTRR